MAIVIANAGQISKAAERPGVELSLDESKTLPEVSGERSRRMRTAGVMTRSCGRAERPYLFRGGDFGRMGGTVRLLRFVKRPVCQAVHLNGAWRTGLLA